MSWSARVGARREVRPVEGGLDDLRAAWRSDKDGRADVEVFARAALVLRDGLALDVDARTRPDGRAA